MAEESKGFPMWAWVLVGLAVLYYLSNRAAAAGAGAAKQAGYGAGRGAVDATVDKLTSSGAVSAIGSFFGGLFGGGKSSGAGPGGTSAAFSDDSSLSTSNWISDQVSADDSASGVVGFGGWD